MEVVSAAEYLESANSVHRENKKTNKMKTKQNKAKQSKQHREWSREHTP